MSNASIGATLPHGARPGPEPLRAMPWANGIPLPTPEPGGDERASPAARRHRPVTVLLVTLAVGLRVLLWISTVEAAFSGAVPRPLPEHPGNVFLAGEPAEFRHPLAPTTRWELRDYDGRVVRQGQGPEAAVSVSTLSVGYYEFRPVGAAPSSTVSLAVLAPLRRPVPLATPLAVDTSMAWFYPESAHPAVASLCALAGVKWVRDRLDWAAVSPKPGQWGALGSYDSSARAQSQAGLAVLQVNHSTPAWANPDRRRFPEDLREVFFFYREMAARWTDTVRAFEPWNEADMDLFGGHTAGEIASFQKAAYWGLKEGSPKVVVCQSPLVYRRPERLEEYRENRVWPYFETFNFHHYVGLDRLPDLYRDFRTASVGRPLWVSECCLPLETAANADAIEPADLRRQAERVSSVLAVALSQRAQRVFYFCLPRYSEGRLQYGLLRQDLTPRPAFVALAAAGRWLAAAEPLGRQIVGDTNVHAYWFRAKPDGRECEVMVCWSEAASGRIEPPGRPQAAYDLLGREVPSSATLVLDSSPKYLLFRTGAAARVKLQPPPAPVALAVGEPCALVLQAVWPRTRTVGEASAYAVTPSCDPAIPLYLYHFGTQPARGRVRLISPASKLLAEQAEIEPGARLSLSLPLRDLPASNPGDTLLVVVEGDFGHLGQTRLAFRLRLESSGPP